MNKLIEAWKVASVELGIKIKTDFFIQLENEKINFDLLIENFGSKNGTVIFTVENMNDLEKAKKYGFYCSALSLTYRNYNREIFIETLNDWGYFGLIDEKPDWYDGHIYNKN